jgi:hypothetical protein
MGEGRSLGSRLGETAEKGERVCHYVDNVPFYLSPFFLFYFSPYIEIGERARFDEAARSWLATFYVSRKREGERYGSLLNFLFLYAMTTLKTSKNDDVSFV